MTATVSQSQYHTAMGSDGMMDQSASSSSSGPSKSRFADISMDALNDLFEIGKECLETNTELEQWMIILSALDDTREARALQRQEWSNRIESLQSQLTTLKNANPRSTWMSSAAHSQQMAKFGQRTMELAKQCEKLDTMVSRTEAEVRDCKEQLIKLERDDLVDGLGGVEGMTDEEKAAMEKQVFILKMFRQLGFHPRRRNKDTDQTLTSTTLSSSTFSASSNEDQTVSDITNLIVRSDKRGKVKTFNVEDETWEQLTAGQQAEMINEMWDAID